MKDIKLLTTTISNKGIETSKFPLGYTKNGYMMFWEPWIASYLFYTSELFYTDDMTVFLNTNDTFFEAADLEVITDSNDMFEILKLTLVDPIYGSTYWAAKKRNMLPLPRIHKKMVALGYDFTGMEPNQQYPDGDDGFEDDDSTI